MGVQIAADAVSAKPLLVVGILTGAVLFCADLIRAMASVPLELQFVRASSYGDRQVTSGTVELSCLPFSTLVGRHVLVVEDILDSGNTLSKVCREFETLGAEQVRTAVLLVKPDRTIVPDYVGFEIDDRFVVGYGLDDAGRWRNLPYIGYV